MTGIHPRRRPLPFTRTLRAWLRVRPFGWAKKDRRKAYPPIDSYLFSRHLAQDVGLARDAEIRRALEERHRYRDL